jgi:hypothetical protein
MDRTVEIARSAGDRIALMDALRTRAYFAVNEDDPVAAQQATEELDAVASDGDLRGRLIRAELKSIAAAAAEGRASDRHVELMRSYLSSSSGRVS